MPTIEVSEETKRIIDNIKKKGFRYGAIIPATDDDVITALLSIANNDEVKEIDESLKDYAEGRFKRGSVNDILDDLDGEGK